MARKTNPLLAVGYIRVSTDEQSLGPTAQRKALETWAATNGVTLVAVFEDRGISGATPHTERPGMTSALAAMATCGAGLLLAAKRDRLARSLGIVSGIETAVAKIGARIVTADGVSESLGSSRVLLEGMSDVIATFERAVIRERTKAALGVKKSRGERVGSVPYGYTVAADGVRLEPVQAEQAVLDRARTLRARGISLRAIALALGPVSRAGTVLSHKTLGRALAGE